MSFSQAVSGLNAASNNLDVIGNNIANSATVGFKAGTISFADMFAGGNVGMGTKVAAVMQDFGDGSLNSSSRNLDVAISGGGFFRMQDTNGSIYYSRNGQFTLDGATRNIINMQGMQLTGYPATGTPPTIQQGADPVPLSIPETAMPSKATTVASMLANLNSSAPTQVFDPANPASTNNYKGTLTTYDSLGNVHNMGLYFVKTGDNQWTVNVRDDSLPISADPADDFTQIQLTFDGSGKLTSQSQIIPPATTPTTGPSQLTLNTLNGSTQTNFTLDFAGSLQQNFGSNSNKSPTQDGYAPGNLTGYSVNNDGTVVASYSNTKTQVLGQIALAGFSNPEGLSPQGDNVWSDTDRSGQAVVGVAGSGSLGKLKGNATEGSNVDMSKELVNMIVAQRNYQSNAQTIKTQDSILQTLVSLR